jgi:predicted TIM-barrel fold metal-dependent hydrolase
LAEYELIDALCCPGPVSAREPGRPYTMEDLLAEHARFGICKRLCLHAESRDGVPDEGNAEMLRLTGLNPGTGAVWTVLPPRRFHAEPVDDLISRAQAAGVAAFAMFPKRQLHSLAPWSNADLYAAMAEVRLPLYLDWEQIVVQELYETAKAYSAMPIIVWNAHYRTDRFLIPIMDQCPNVHVGLAARFVQSQGLEDFRGRYGPGRLIYGSNWPVQSPGPLISYVTYSLLDDDSRQAILSGNITRLLQDIAWPVRPL